MTDDEPDLPDRPAPQLPGHALTDEERGAPTSRRRQVVTFAGVVVVIAAAVVGMEMDPQFDHAAEQRVRCAAWEKMATTGRGS